MLKRARQLRGKNHNDGSQEDPLSQKARKQAGDELRRFLLDKFCMEGMSGCDVALISHYITRAGGLGVDDLALKPGSASKNGHRHVKSKAGKIFPEVDLSYISCPVNLKRESTRSSENIPMYLPSTAFKNFVTEEMVYNHSADDFAKVVGGLDNYMLHPTVQLAASEGLKAPVRPIALYWDGVAYTKNDSFWGFYVTDILTTQKFLSFLIRTNLSGSIQS